MHVQNTAHARAIELRDAVDDAHRLLRNAESRVASRESALQEAEFRLQASRAEGEDLSARLSLTADRLQGVDAQVSKQQVGTSSLAFQVDPEGFAACSTPDYQLQSDLTS